MFLEFGELLSSILFYCHQYQKELSPWSSILRVFSIVNRSLLLKNISYLIARHHDRILEMGIFLAHSFLGFVFQLPSLIHVNLLKKRLIIV